MIKASKPYFSCQTTKSFAWIWTSNPYFFGQTNAYFTLGMCNLIFEIQLISVVFNI